ncbi:hypothetical protein L3Y34_009616 [Caenorhabditis briggsae]|uniref:Uncharacterized protein n=1 Tax=Caenorhabditis briggsae TaxID=6238 RepID=A0AAE9A984_CAEBR|nr:hypothetical protein L3Y34_009616 [Caenorhabditis briggsae]
MEVDPPNTALSPTTVVRPSHIPILINNAIEDKEKITVADGQEYLKRQREDDWIENRVARIEAQNGKLDKLRSDVKVEEAKLENLEREYKSEVARIKKRRELYDKKASSRVERRQAGKIIKKHKRELEKKQEKLRDEMEELHLDKI